MILRFHVEHRRPGIIGKAIVAVAELALGVAIAITLLRCLFAG